MFRSRKRLDPSQTGQEALKLHTDLSNRIVGQDEAIAQIVGIYQTYLSGMSSPGRPIGNLLFLGPTGTGKTSGPVICNALTTKQVSRMGIFIGIQTPSAERTPPYPLKLRNPQ